MTAQRISVIVPVFNAAAYLREAIDSVLGQTHKPFEVIVIDDGSTDESTEIAASYESRIRYVHQSNQGSSQARNHGLDLAAGDFLAFIDADDIWVDTKLERQIDFLAANPSVDYSIGKIRYFLQPGKTVPNGFKEELLTKDVVGQLLGTLLARRSVFDRVGNFDRSLSIAHDVDWFVRADELGISSAVLEDVLMLKRVHEDNISNSAAVNNQELLGLLRQSLKRRQ